MPHSFTNLQSEALSKHCGYMAVDTKLDAGTQSWFERVDGTKLSLDKVTQNITWQLASTR